jgi:putative nucleotide binding protein
MNAKEKKHRPKRNGYRPPKSHETRTNQDRTKRKRNTYMKRFGLIVDFFPSGRSIRAQNRNQRSSKPVAHVLDGYFSLLELTLPDGLHYNLNSTSGKSIKFHRGQIIQRLQFKDLSEAAQGQIPSAVEKIVYGKPRRFLDFFNKAESISPRLHQLRLLPGIGTARMWKILEARKIRLFTSVEDLKERTGLSDPLGMIIQRIIEEIKEQPNYPLFVRNSSDSTRKSL